MDTPLQEEIEAGRAPTLQFLRDNGAYYQRVVSSFPTMSVTIDTTLLTGEVPNKHGIYGLAYFHEQEKRVINFGTGPKEAFLFGLQRVLHATMMQLNQHLISKEVTTIHEETDKPTASINATIYRGRKRTYLKSPWYTWLFGLLPRKIRTFAPDTFSFGSMHPIDKKSKFGGIWSRIGFNDRFSQMEVVSLIKRNKLPPLSIIYFPGNDSYVHKKGTSEGKGIAKADKALAFILDAFGSWEEAIHKCNFIVLGDSGQTNMMKKDAYVDMQKVLHPFSIMPLSRQTPLAKDQLVLCVNERMSFISIQDDQVSYQDVVKACKAEKRVDVIAWKENGWIHVVSGQKDGALSFQAGSEYVDEYDQKWQLEGDISILDLTIDGQKLSYGIYPDALSRLSGVINPEGRTIIVTVSPGYEMLSYGSPKHKGAAHGSLHHLDSLAPMIVTGIKSKPDYLRLIDVKKWLLGLLEE